jgi:hypothetical protein
MYAVSFIASSAPMDLHLPLNEPSMSRNISDDSVAHIPPAFISQGDLFPETF